ncbi:MAG: biotin--[acetyl-CoA-carboxylase] ligase [Gemmatimonadota bacterium]
MTLRENMGGPPLSAAALTAALVRPGGLWRRIEVVAQTGSTNADLLALAAAGGAAGTVLAAEAQHAGKGRLGRTWTTPPGAGLTFSVLLRPAGVPAAGLGWLPLLAGVAAAAAVREVTGVPARLKWPNDLLAGERKLAGILAESRGQAVVVGVGLNVSQRAGDLPVPTATSLLLEQAALPAGRAREAILTAILTGLERWYTAWTAAAGDADGCGLRAEYLRQCATVGREVRVLLPGDRALTGRAADVDALGRLVVRTPAGLTAVSAGDVVHVR